MSRLRITILVENTTVLDRDYFGEAGLSLLLQTGGRKIVFDTGLMGVFLTNARKMGISLADPDFIVLSHGHLDHTGGLPVLARHLQMASPGKKESHIPRIIAHSRCFWPKEKEGHRYGSPMEEAEVRRQFPVTLSDRPVRITDDLVFLGGIPCRFTFERTDPGKRLIRCPDGTTEPDNLRDDSALAFRSEEGLVIITGCSHAGICNIAEYAREVCGESRVAGIIGGLHLISPRPRRLKMTGEYLQKLQLPALHACHCTSLAAKIALAGYVPMKEVGVGMEFEW